MRSSVLGRQDMSLGRRYRVEYAILPPHHRPVDQKSRRVGSSSINRTTDRHPTTSPARRTLLAPSHRPKNSSRFLTPAYLEAIRASPQNEPNRIRVDRQCSKDQGRLDLSGRSYSEKRIDRLSHVQSVCCKCMLAPLSKVAWSSCEPFADRLVRTIDRLLT